MGVQMQVMIPVVYRAMGHGSAEAEKALSQPAVLLPQESAGAPAPGLDAQMPVHGQTEAGRAPGQKERDRIAFQQQEPGNSSQKVQDSRQGGFAHVVP